MFVKKSKESTKKGNFLVTSNPFYGKRLITKTQFVHQKKCKWDQLASFFVDNLDHIVRTFYFWYLISHLSKSSCVFLTLLLSIYLSIYLFIHLSNHLSIELYVLKDIFGVTVNYKPIYKTQSFSWIDFRELAKDKARKSDCFLHLRLLRCDRSDQKIKHLNIIWIISGKSPHFKHLKEINVLNMKKLISAGVKMQGFK